jgi:hypothetical protein
MISLALALLYPIAIQYKRGGAWSALLPLAFVTGVIDVIANYTELALLTWQFPLRTEPTFSHRLYRLRKGNRWQRFVARVVIPYLNFFDPGHIKDEPP